MPSKPSAKRAAAKSRGHSASGASAGSSEILKIMCSKDALSKALMASQSVQLKDPKIARLLAAVVVGLDTETKPEFRKTSTPNATSLLQVAVRDVHGREDVFLFDLLALSPSHYDHMLADLFQNPAILKLGQGLLNDLKARYTLTFASVK
ncbi:hypothetical protein AaE_001238 [Aphanomyces astaci]|uniref:3'-5' exonuclease domain-containing protein n=1 Tax=Aphanomyces astaci TaxID=112090 RepID=A0A6A5AXH0_APHAT|nr:hypothetical protein AaE_001238 [Aphanomyces astaci]